MPDMISYSIGYTAIDAAETSVTVAPPPACQAGDLLVMGVIAGGAAAAPVPATAPPGWTALSESGRAPAVFLKAATSGEPESYTVTLDSAATAAVFVAAYPAATIASSTSSASDDDVISYSPAFPAGVSPSSYSGVWIAATSGPASQAREPASQARDR